MAVIKRTNARGKVIGYFAVVNYVDLDGKRRQTRRNARTQGEADEIEADLIGRRKRGELPGQKPTPEALTVEKYLDRWIGHAQVKPSTLTRYRELLAHIKREAGAPLLRELTTADVLDAYKRLRERGLSAKTVLNAHRVLRTALNDAVDDELIGRNPAPTKKRAPKAPRYEVNPPTPDETRRLIQAAVDTPYGAIVAVAAWTGARQGELLSLRWEDVDLDAPDISIRTSKTDSGRRRIPLTPATVATLREHRLRQLKQRYDLTDPETGRSAWTDTGLVFTSAIGTRIDDSNLRRAWTGTICKQAGVKARFHDLRHGFATFLLSQNVHPKIVSSLLGHSRIAITLDTYSHVMPSLGLEAQAMTALDDALGAKGRG